MDIRKRIESALAKPIARDGYSISVDDFDPWEDVIHGIHGSYSSQSDELMIAALEAVRDGKTFEFMDQHGFVGEFLLYVLSGHGLTEYGTSPRGGWPDPSIRNLWDQLIDKWKEHSRVVWQTD